LVKDFTLNTAENNPTVDSTSSSRPLNIWPRAELSMTPMPILEGVRRVKRPSPE
jgi:hypothetical protein